MGPWLCDWNNVGWVSEAAFPLLEAFGSVYLDAGFPPKLLFPLLTHVHGSVPTQGTVLALPSTDFVSV